MVSALKVGGRSLYEMARAGEEIERARPPRANRRARRRGSRARRVSGGDDPGRLLERDLHPDARGRSRRRAGRVRASRRVCGACGSAAFVLDEAPSDRGDRGGSRAAVLAPVRSHARSGRGAWSTRSRRRAVMHGATFAAPASDRRPGRRRAVRGRRRERRAARGVRAPGRRREAVGRDRRRAGGLVKTIATPPRSPPVRSNRSTNPRQGSDAPGTSAAGRSRSVRSTASISATRPSCASSTSSRGLAGSPPRSSPSTAIRPRSCGPDPPRSSSPRSTRSSSCSTRPVPSTNASYSPFDATRSKEPAEQFVEELLASALARPARRRRRRLPLRVPPPR